MSAFIAVFFALVALNANLQLVTLQEPPQIDTGNTEEDLIARLTNSVNALAINVADATSDAINGALERVNEVVTFLPLALKPIDLTGSPVKLLQAALTSLQNVFSPGSELIKAIKNLPTKEGTAVLTTVAKNLNTLLSSLTKLSSTLASSGRSSDATKELTKQITDLANTISVKINSLAEQTETGLD